MIKPTPGKNMFSFDSFVDVGKTTTSPAQCLASPESEAVVLFEKNQKSKIIPHPTKLKLDMDESDDDILSGPPVT